MANLPMKPGSGGNPASIAATRRETDPMVSQLAVRVLAGVVDILDRVQPPSAPSSGVSAPSSGQGAHRRPRRPAAHRLGDQEKAEMAAVEPIM